MGVILILGFIFIRPQKNKLAFHRQLFGPWQYTGEIPGVMKTSLGNDKNQVMVKVERGDSSLQFNVPLSNTSETNKNQTIIFSEKTKTIDTSYKLTNEGIKEEITLYKIPQENVFKNTITTNNLIAKISSEGVPVFFDTKGVYQFHFSRPFVRDAAGNISYAVSYTIGQTPDPFHNTNGKESTKQLLSATKEVSQDQNYTISVTVDSAWLHDPKRKLPIVIDPTVVHDTSSEFASGNLNRVSDTGSETSPKLEGYYQELSSDVNTVALWHMNEGSGDIQDSSGNANVGSPTGTTVVTGPLGNARGFNGTSSDYITVNPTAVTSGSYTVELWVQPNSYTGGVSGNPEIISTRTGSDFSFDMQLTSSSIHQDIGNGSSWITTSADVSTIIPLNSWSHIATVVTNIGWATYVNGTLAGSGKYYSSSFPLLSDSTHKIMFGTVNGTTNFLNGSIDEVRISNVARSSEEIQMDASRRPYSTYTSPVIDLVKPVVSWNNFSWTSLGEGTGNGEVATSSATANMVTQWNFNETSGTTAVSGGTCGTTCNGTLTGFASTGSQDSAVGTGWTAANRRWGAGALMFDGAGEYVSAPDNASLSLPGDITVTSWIFMPAAQISGAAIVTKGNGGGGESWNMDVVSGNSIRFMRRYNSGAAFTSATAPNVSYGQWHYVAGVTTSGQTDIYIDGKKTAGNTTATPFDVNTHVVSIGSRQSGSTTYDMNFNGVIDSTAVFSRALTASEILSNYNASKIEFQTRVGTSANPNDGTWEAWKPSATEQVIDSMDTSSDKWAIDNSQNYPSALAKTGIVNVGTGGDGACTVSSGTTNLNTGSCSGRGTADAVNFSSTVLTSIGTTSITLSTSPTGLTAGDEVLIINLQGTMADYDNVGQYETHTISSISTNTLNFTDSPIQNTFDGTTQKIMVQRIPNYTNVTVSAGAILTASAWNSAKGGTLFFRANGTVTNGGTISMNGSGFVGGSPGGNSIGTDNCLLDGTSANGRAGESFGGATTTPSCTGATRRSNLGGGSGGAGYATWYTPYSVEGGSGGSYGTLGTAGTGDSATGTPGTVYGNNNNIFLGSGGGSAGGWTGGTAHVGGLGGTGGGIISISSNTLTNNGSITANGNRGLNSNADVGGNGAAGGGGSGGTIVLNANTLTVGSGKVIALGGITSQQSVQCGGTSPRCGGHGGTGRIALSYSSAISGVTSPTAIIQKLQPQVKQEGTGAVQVSTGRIDTDSSTVGLWHLDETSGTGAYLRNSSSSDASIFLYTGADQTFTVPSDVTSINIKMWGGGGGGGNPGGWTYGYPGGGGGYTMGTLAVTPGQVLTVMVGAGGTNGSIVDTVASYGGGGPACASNTDCRYGGQGGGRSAIRYSSTDLITAGGGGGGGATYLTDSNNSGGGAGGATGATGSSATNAASGGGGGSQTAGGIAGTGSASGATAGTQYAGGYATAGSYGGGGGGGWYGGGGGAYNVDTISHMGGGGGGSSYVGGTGVSSAYTLVASGTIQGNSSDPVNNGAGAGGATSTNGANGKVVISYNSFVAANNGTPTGTTVVDGISGKARSFNGTTDYIDLGNPNSLQTTGNQTIEMWLKPAALDARRNPYSKSYGGEGTITLEINGTLSYFYGTNGNDGLPYQGFNTGVPIPAGQWSHIAIVRNLTTMELQWYINGVLVNRVDATYSYAATSTQHAYIGKGYVSPFLGSIDEVRISSSARTPDEIAQSYQMGRDHRISKTITLTDLSASNKVPFSIASDRLGTFSQVTIGKSAFTNYESDPNTVRLWHLDEDQNPMPAYFDYDSFEGGPGSSDDWQLRNTVDPDITSTTAYTGTKSLHMSAGWGRNFEGTSGEPSTGPYDTATYPYMCMAYKIPSTTLNNMLILVDGAWHSVTMTQGETPTSYSKVASWNPLIANNAWHYKCINLNTQLNASLGGTTHSISAVIWHDGGGMGVIAGEFWIDDFLIAAQTYYPTLNYPKDSSGNTPDSQQAPIVATGGTISHVNGYTIHSFTATGTFQVTSGNGIVDALVVAGGGGGANTGSGGGGGGFVQGHVPITTGSYTITVGAGGSGGLTTAAPGVKGGNSVFSTVTAEGGGNGVSHGGNIGGSGGSGGGGSISTSGTAAAGGTGSQGSAGGAGYVEASWIGNSGGGGGAATVGAAGGNTAGTGNGGTGLQNSFTGTSTYYAGGGGAGEVSGSFVGAGGTGGGGGATVDAAGTSGTANTGGGGGGGSYNAGVYTNGGNGGSGIVIIRYPDQAPTIHATSIGTTSVPGIMGKARSFNGAGDYINAGSGVNLVGTSFTLSAWAKVGATSVINPILSQGLSSTTNNLLQMGFRATNVFYCGFYANDTDTTITYTDTNWHLWTCTYDVSTNARKIYRDGILQASGTAAAGYTGTGDFFIGNYYNTYYFNGSIDEVRVDKVVRSQDEIRQTYEIGARTQSITIDFKAKLNSSNLISGSSDYSFAIDERPYGSSLAASHIFPGEKIIVKENIDGADYMAQGLVTSVDNMGGGVSVLSWDAGSSFPTGGYDVNATVFKWQKEYFDINDSLSTQRSAITRLTYRIVDGSQGANVWLDDLRSSTNYLNNGSTIASSVGNRYFQYRAILSQDDITAPSSALATLTLNYANSAPPNLPTLDTPADAATGVALLPVLRTTATDPDSDAVKYKIALCADAAMTVNCQTFDQTTPATGWSASSYASGVQGVYTLQTPLNPNTTYYWKSQAIDPSGSNTWSATQATAYSFTTVNYAMATGCKVEHTAPTTFVISWIDNSTQETGYSLQRSTNGGSTWNSFQPSLIPGTVTYTDSPISLNTNYQYRVAPYFADGSFAPWCYTSTINIGSGTFNMNGINLNGIKIN